MKLRDRATANERLEDGFQQVLFPPHPRNNPHDKKKYIIIQYKEEKKKKKNTWALAQEYKKSLKYRSSLINSAGGG